MTVDEHINRIKQLSAQYLSQWTVSISKTLPRNPDKYSLIVLWNLTKIIDVPINSRVVIFHSSDLPKGRGWAPIFHALANENKQHVITAVMAAPKVDSGDMVAKARFTIEPSYTADILREFDEETCMILTSLIVERYESKPIKAIRQVGPPSYYQRRTPDDNMVDGSKSLNELLPVIKASGKAHRAYIMYNKTKFYIHIEPDVKPEFPSDLRIEFFE